MAKILKNKIGNFFVTFFIFLLITTWIFSGWPQIWQKPSIPPALEKTYASGSAFEAGEVTIDDSLDWENITLSGSYSTVPVILATPVTANNCEAQGSCAGNSTGGGGGMYPIPLVKNVSTTSFDISMCVDGGSTTCSTGVSAEKFHWFAFDVDYAASYDWIEVGTTANVDVGGGDTAETFTTSFVATPDVWTQAQTYSQGSNIGAIAWVDDDGKTTGGFTYVGCVHTGTGDSCDGAATDETFGYVAIDTINQAFESGVNFQSGYADISNSVWTTATFSPEYTNPRVMVTQNDDDGGQDPEYAWARSVIGSGMNFRYCEEDSGTTCNTHTDEKTYWFAVEEPAVGPMTKQLHFRWRDDTTDLNTSGGWLTAEDSNSIGDVTKNTTYRLRVESARINGAESGARSYELQWGDKTGQSSCDNVTGWTGVSNTSDEFDMVDSANISPDGETTSPGLLANSEGYNYTSGEGRDTADTTGSIGPLSTSYYTELEYSFKATDEAVTGRTYCFRLYDTTAGSALDAYSVYPEATVSLVAIGTISMEWGTETGVSDDDWSTINFAGSYTNPVFICIFEYNNMIGNESDGTADSVVCRVQNVGSTSAQVRIQEAGETSGTLSQDETIHWMVVEEGEYDTDDIKMEAFSYLSTVTDAKNSWNGQLQSYTQSYINPVVLGQVMTYNDSDWSIFFAKGSAQADPPDSSNFNTGKHVAEDTVTTRNDETIGVVVIEQGNGTLGTVDYEAYRGAASIDRIDDGTPPYSYTFQQAFSSTPAVAIISQAGISGGDGPHPCLYGTTPLSTTQINMAIMEDEIGDTEQGGNTEAVAYMVFESAGTYTAGEVALDQTTYRFYDNADSVQPTTPKAAENTAITDVADTDIVRIRIAIQAGLNNLSASSQVFKLQYGQGFTCSAIEIWIDVDSFGGAGIWRGYDNTTPADGAQITSSLLNSQSNALESYEEQNNSVSNPTAISEGSRGEWDWVVQNNGASAGTDYCFRMTLSDGSVIQYTNYPKLTTATANQSPTVSNVSLNSGSHITLNAGNTISVSATATITDPDGYSDISSATGKIYRSGVSGESSCNNNDNNCYEDADCGLSGCSGNSCTATCTINMQFHADPTDEGIYAQSQGWDTQEWVAWIEATDSQSQTDSADNSSSEDVDVNTLLAFSLDTSAIAYGTVNPNQVSSQQGVQVQTEGNVPIDINVSGTNMTWSGNIIDVSQQKYSLNTGFDWDTQGTALSGTPIRLEFESGKPTQSPTNETDDTYWKLKVPLDKSAGGPYSGVNTFSVVAD